MDQDNAVWRVLANSLLPDTHFSRATDKTGILDDLGVAIGPASAMCVLGDNVIGAAGWAQIPLDRQYEAVTSRAGAFVASNMLYLRFSGPQAAAALDWLTPRDVSRLPVGQGMFVLFTNVGGGIDEEAIVLRTAQQEYLQSMVNVINKKTDLETILNN